MSKRKAISKKVRFEVFKRDNFTCQRCFDDTNTLTVHHVEYLKNKQPWEYDNKKMITLCNVCHNGFHASDAKNENTFHSIRHPSSQEQKFRSSGRNF